MLSLIPRSALVTACFVLTGTTAPLSFATEVGTVTYAGNDAPGSGGEPRVDLLDPKLRGVALTDAGIDEGAMVSAYLRHEGVLPLGAVLSTSIVNRYADHLIVDVVGRATRFQDTDTMKAREGRVGFMRVKVPVSSADGICNVGLPEVLFEKSLSDLDLRYRVSVTEWAGVIEDPATGFRRVFPLGGGSIDRGVRVAGYLTTMTPTTEDGLLEKTYAWRQLKSPWYFRNKPYLPISIGHAFTRADGTTGKYYSESNIAFHIWQDKGFERGFFSHGCMRLRTEDLAELAAFVFGAPRPIPTTLRVGPIGDAIHPYPFDTQKYWQLKNYGTTEKPKTRLKYMLYETELGTEPLPPLDQIRALGFNEKPVVAVADQPSKPTVPGATSTDIWALFHWGRAQP